MLPTQEALKTTYNQAVLNDIIALNKPYYIIHNTAFASSVIFVPKNRLHRCNLTDWRS